MSNQIIYFKQLSRKQKTYYRQNLLKKNKDICDGILCKGKIKSLSEFSNNKNNKNNKNNMSNINNNKYNKCNVCKFDEILNKNSYTLKYIYLKMKCDRKYNKDKIGEWKELNKLNKLIKNLQKN